MCEISSKQGREVNYNLKTLIRGLTQDNISEVYKAYKVLFQIGVPAIPEIQDVLLRFDFSRVKYSSQFRMFIGTHLDKFKHRKKKLMNMQTELCLIATAYFFGSFVYSKRNLLNHQVQIC